MRRLSFCALVIALAICSTVASAQVQISQVYGAGGNINAPLKSDYIEIYNAGPPQLLTGWAVQYASATGSAWTVTALPAVTLGTGQYLLVQEATTATAPAADIPTADMTASIAMSATDFKVALTNTTVALATATPTYAAQTAMVDMVGVGTTTTWNDSAAAGGGFLAANNAPATAEISACFRLGCGGTDTNNSRADWGVGWPNPRNTATALSAGLNASGIASPHWVESGKQTRIMAIPRDCATDGPASVLTATIDLTGLGLGAAQPLFDDATNGDEVAGDGIWSYLATVAAGPGTKNLAVTFTGSNGGCYIPVVVTASPATPDNDNCHTATNIMGPYTPPVVVADNFTGASVEYAPLNSAAGFTGGIGMTNRQGLWYTVTGTGNTMTATTCGSPVATLDTQMNVMCGTCDGLTVVGSNNTSSAAQCATSTSPATVSWCSTSGQIYYIWVAQNVTGASTALINLTISDNATPCATQAVCTVCGPPPTAGATLEVERPLGPGINDGCDSVTNKFQDVTLTPTVPFTIVGQGRGWLNLRDVDWYRFTAPTGGFTCVADGQFAGIMQLVQLGAGGTCTGTVVLATTASSNRCNSVSVAANLFAANTYAIRWLHAPTPTSFGGMTTGGTSSAYRLVLTNGLAAINDVCASASVIPGAGTGPGGVTSDNSTATLDGLAVGCGALVDQDVWYSFTPNVTCNTWDLSLCGLLSFDSVLEIYDGCGGLLLNCNDDDVTCGSGLQSRILGVSLTAGTNYRIRVAAKVPSPGGTFNLVVVPSPVVGAPLNDVCGANMASFTIPCAGGTVCGNLTTANSEGLLASSCMSGTGQRDVYYYFTPCDPCATGYQFTTCNPLATNVDTVISIHSTCPTVAAHNQVSTADCFDEGCGVGNFSNGIATDLVVGTPYIIRVGMWSSGATPGPFQLTVTPILSSANDFCVNAANLVLPATVASTTACATNDGSATCDGSGLAGRDLWYKFTLASTTTVRIDTCGSAIDTAVSVYSGICGGLTEIACNDDSSGCPCAAPASSLELTSLAPGTYTVRVSDKGTAGAFTLRVYSPVLPNDDCCNAILLACPSTTAATTVGSTPEVGLPPTCVGPAVPNGAGGTQANSFTYTNSVWYKVVGTGGTITADTVAGATDTKIFVWTGTCGTLTCVTANDDINSTFVSKVAWVSNLGQDYYLMVGRFSGTGAFSLTLSCAATPPNDLCAAPTVLAPTGGSMAGTTVGSTTDFPYTAVAAYPSCVTVGAIFDVWYSYTACANGNLSVNTCGLHDTLLSVHTTCPTTPAGPSNQLGTNCNNNGVSVGCTPGSELTLAVTSGTTYLIRVTSSPGTNAGAFTLNWAATGIPSWFQDFDGDGFGNPGVFVVACNPPSGYVGNNQDCNDANGAIKPGATEVCDGVDNDCDGLTDDADPGITGQATFYQDADSDGFGNPGAPLLACVQPSGYVLNNQDCNDGDNMINPNATEVCDTVDNDCDGDIDEGVATTYYQDFDNDTFGNPAVSVDACVQPSGYVLNNTDCDDNNNAVNPNGVEVCNGIDDDCDSITDEGCPSNDFCVSATPIGNGSVTGNNNGAATEVTSLTCGAVSNDIWYSYTNALTCTKTVTVSMCPNEGGSATFDAVLHAFSGTCGSLTLLACNNSTCGTNPKISFDVPGLATALIAVSAVAPGPGGSFKMVVSHKTAAFLSLGPGCSAGGGSGPSLTVDGAPVLGSVRILGISGAAPNSGGLLLVSPPAAPAPILGCNLYVDGGGMVILSFIATDAAGNWFIGGQLPTDPIFECGVIHVQGAIFPLGGVPAFQLTEGLQLTLGY